MVDEVIELDRRGGQRMNGETLVRFEGRNFSIYSKATDISPTGAFLATHYLLDPGTTIDLHLIDSRGNESVTKAKVVRAMTRTTEKGELRIGLGVQFLNEQHTDTSL